MSETVKKTMRKIGRVALYAILLLGFSVSMGIHKDTQYVPWAVDLHHISTSIAFLCAAGCGAMWARM